jgi:hypothetical protein
MGRRRCPVRKFLDRVVAVATYLAVIAVAVEGSSRGMKW